MEPTLFTLVEAEEKVHKKVQAREALVHIPTGTTGTVIGFESVGLGGYKVMVQWDLRPSSDPLVDWFSKDQYEQYLDQLDGLEEEPKIPYD